MKTTAHLKKSLAIAMLLALPAVYAANLSKTDYSSGKSRISSDYKADKAACGALAGNTKDICVEEAKAKEKVAKAELEYEYSGKSADWTKVQVAKAESAYAVAKERCDDLAGNAKDVCVKEAKAVEVKALVDARMSKQITETRKDGAQNKLDADYKVATEKCETFSGDAKSSCMAAAKSRFGKT